MWNCPWTSGWRRQHQSVWTCPQRNPAGRKLKQNLLYDSVTSFTSRTVVWGGQTLSVTFLHLPCVTPAWPIQHTKKSFILTPSTSLSPCWRSHYKELILWSRRLRLTRRNLRGREDCGWFPCWTAALPAHHHEVWGDPGHCWWLLQVPTPAPVHPVPPPCHPPLTLPSAQLHLCHSSSPLRHQEPGGKPQPRGASPVDPPSGWRLLQLLQDLWPPTDLGLQPEKWYCTLSTWLDLRPIPV